MADIIQHRRDTLANWISANPVLMDGEMVLVATDETKPYVYDSKKVGDGVHAFNDLEMLGYNCLQELGDSTLFPISQKAVTIMFKEKALLVLDQGSWLVTTQEPKNVTNRVRTRYLIDPFYISKIKTRESIKMYVYMYDKNGKFEREISVWTTEFTLTNDNFKDKLFNFVFAKGEDYKENITPEEVYSNLEIEYVNLDEKYLSYQVYNNYFIKVSNWELKSLFISNNYSDVVNKSYFPSEYMSGEFSCLTIPVKIGDTFTVTITGGKGYARAYALYKTDGTKYFIAEAGAAFVDEIINIEEDGFIVFNSVKGTELSILANTNIPHDWAYLYFAGMYEDYKGIKSDVNDLESIIGTFEDSLYYIKKDLYGGLKLTVSSEWSEGYLRTNYLNTNTAVDFDSVKTDLPGWHYKIIECRAGDKFIVHIRGGASEGRAWNFLSKDKRVISQSSEATWLDLELIAPEEAAYLVLNVNNETSTAIGELPIWQPDEEEDIQQIKILCFGNSFTQDSMSYVPFMLKNLAPNVKLTLGIAYIGGCPLVQHLANFTGEDQTLNSVVYTQVNYTYYKSVNGEAWTSQGSKNVDAMIADEKWDIITFQQNGNAAYQDWDTYFAPFIFKLHKSLFNKMGYGIKLGWLLTQGAYASDYEGLLNHWQGTVNNSKKILEMTGTSILFPFGTAVQNLRTTSLKEIGDGEAHNLMADTGHLQEGIGCMTAAYTNTLVILNHLGIGKTGVIGEQTRVDSTFVTEKNIPGPNLGTSGVVGISDDNCYLAQIAAECAVKNPYSLTDLSQIENL